VRNIKKANQIKSLLMQTKFLLGPHNKTSTEGPAPSKSNPQAKLVWRSVLCARICCRNEKKEGQLKRLSS